MTNANKVKVSKEVAEAIDRVKGGLMTVGTFSEWLDGEWTITGPNKVIMLELTKDEAVSVVLYGYEIEETPAEKVAEYYRISKAYEKCCEYRRGKAETVEFVAKAYGLKIEGVNV